LSDEETLRVKKSLEVDITTVAKAKLGPITRKKLPEARRERRFKQLLLSPVQLLA
jgi:hypothetical protein